MIPWLFTALFLLHNFNDFIVFDLKSPNCSFVDTDMTDESENETPQSQRRVSRTAAVKGKQSTHKTCRYVEISKYQALSHCKKKNDILGHKDLHKHGSKLKVL